MEAIYEEGTKFNYLMERSLMLTSMTVDTRLGKQTSLVIEKYEALYNKVFSKKYNVHGIFY